MDSIQSGLHAVFEDERLAVTTPGTVVASVTARIGRRRAGKLVGASAGTLAVAGLAAAIPLAFSHGASPSVAPGTNLGTSTAHAAGAEMPPNALGLSCGDPVPPSLLASPDRSEIEVYQTEVTTHPTLGVTAVTSPLPSASAPESLYVSYGSQFSGLIIGRDGAVVGWTDATPPLEAVVRMGADDRLVDLDGVSLSHGRLVWCPDAPRSGLGDSASDATIPASGSYLTYPIPGPPEP